ncbi:hypothetical protein [Neisseria bacilliformis]|uniref:hypothetical protein n=1 Tax=Neisseria bacilliformis TaxID=267212 RepID=UPI000A93E339|nr:hypothetical protein [Neisseria bacilliformis]
MVAVIAAGQDPPYIGSRRSDTCIRKLQSGLDFPLRENVGYKYPTYAGYPAFQTASAVR